MGAAFFALAAERVATLLVTLSREFKDWAGWDDCTPFLFFLWKFH
jgi:hypothetical protein